MWGSLCVCADVLCVRHSTVVPGLPQEEKNFVFLVMEVRGGRRV